MMSLNPTFTRVPIRAALSATATIALFALITPSASALPSAAWSEEGTQGGAAYGFGAATAGDINGDGYSDLVVASPWFDVSGSDRGRAWLYSGSPTGLGSATWQTDGTDAGDHYGYSVACVGDVNGDGYDDVLVGAALSDTGAQADDGAIYLYFGSSSGLPTVSSWWSDGPQATALLGSFVAGGADFNGDGYDDLVAGAPGYNPGGLPSAGRIQIYLGSATTPVYSTSIVGTVTGGWVGHVMITLDFNGDGYDDLVTTQLENGQSKHMLFLGNSGGLSTTPAKTFYFGDPINGSAISSAGDVNGDGYEDLLFGEPGATSNAGRIRLWYGSSTLATTAEYWWILDGAASGEKLGSSLGCAGDMNGDGYGDFLVHAEAGSSGQARLFYGSKDGPTYRQVWALADGSDHYFAWRLSTAGDVDGDGYSDLFLASPYEDTPGGGEGRVDVYRGSADSPGAYVQWNAQGSQADCLFGTAVALGDFDGNGTDDIAVGTGSFDGAGVNSGLVSVYDGWDDVADTPEWSVTGETAGLRFGDAIASALDVDGDGYEDLLVGAPGANGGRGEARLYRGGLLGLEAAPAWTVSGPNAGDAFGSAVASAGDLNADGYADVIIGAPGADGTAQYGRAYAYLGSASGLATAPAWSVTGDQAGAKLGFSVACAGDVDGDGHSDVIVGAPLYDHPENDEGVAFVYFGFAGGIVGPGYLLESDDAGAQFGFSVGSAGDTNGDGYADVVIGAPYYGSTDQGHAELYRGAPVGSSLVLAKTWTAQHPQAWFGWSVGGADFDQDGLGDVVVGSPGVDNGQEDEGQVWAYRAPFDTNPWFGTDGNIAFGYHGKSLATGDVSGDGFPDILAGAPGQVGQASGSGIAHLWPGNGMWNGGTTNPTIGEGRPRQLLAYTSNLTAVVPLLGAVSGSQMRFGGYLSSPLGRDRIRLEVEVKPLDVAFDGTGTIFSTWADTGEPQAEGSRVFTTLLSPSLNPGAYHWRARLLGERPYWKRSPWIYPTRSTASEMDFRRRMNVSSVETGDVPSLQLAAYPSVFRGATTLRFEQPRTGPAVLRICDASGREVARPVDGILVAGTHQIAWDPGQVGRDVPNGIYFALFDSGSGHATTKLIRVR